MNSEDWYWKKGLHDAEIEDIVTQELCYDYTQRNPLRNFLEIRLNSKYALFDTTISAIRFYNFSIIKKDCELELLKKSWWIKDTLTRERNRYLIIFLLKNAKKEIEIIIAFDKAEVIRNEL